MILNREVWQLSGYKKLFALLRVITSINDSDFYCWVCLHSFITKNKHESRKKVCKIKIFVMWQCLLKTLRY